MIDKVENRQTIEDMTLIEIKAGLQTEFLGKEIRLFQSLGSTNEKARHLAEEGAPSGTVIIAGEQTAGKGRLGRDWYSPPGSGLWFSLLLRPELKAEEAPFLTIAAALALARTLKTKFKFKPELKWPNDILYKGKKLAGILSELITGTEGVRSAVIGIGINVNQKTFPEELTEKASSLRLILNREIGRVELLQGFLESFEFYYQNLLAGHQEQLMAEWRSALNIIGKDVTIKAATGNFRGEVIGISERGELVLKDTTGKVMNFWAGDVSLRRESKP